jgi:hypothetical protein
MTIELEISEYSLGGDLLRGAKAIASFIGEPDEKRIYYLAECGYLPIGREGAILIASKTALRAHYHRLTQASREAVKNPTPVLSRASRLDHRSRRSRQTRPAVDSASA